MTTESYSGADDEPRAKCGCFSQHVSPSVQSGLSACLVHTVLSHLHAEPKGKAFLHADAGFLPGVPQRPGVHKVTVEMYLQELREA